MLSAYAVLCAIGLQASIKPVTLVQGGTTTAQDQDQKTQTKLLLAPGTPAPDFTVEKWGGGDLKLSNYKGKVVVLDFWSTTAAGSLSALPNTETIYKAVKDQGVAVLEVSTWDERANFEAWIKKSEPSYTVTFGFDPTPKDDTNVAKKLYQVSDLPTTYIIDKDGKVADAFVGYKENDTRLADDLRKLGVKIDQN